MIKFLFIFFIIIFGLYVLFSRKPDFFDGETTTATIHFLKDSTQKVQPYAVFSLDGKDTFRAKANYLFRSFQEHEKVTVIYENSNPQNAAVYSWWGYWISWKELLACIIGYFVLFQAAKSIVNNPSPEAVKELEDYANKPKIRQRRYK
ncbi:hypothetical protein A9P82_06155 [Arachidicoccus ginsenosidimutans]|uniref:hypothetical protein n=1 Tax=Arachidicoccus sp. BS20 TaxID=1850526 RepID=UPI0007F0CA52|nr:hypothetical protein [Arachidicoccus sp. BS20]ANI88913.1 hypothetical protein A9P82_06155 [Arachidicoccus sp. BS20]